MQNPKPRYMQPGAQTPAGGSGNTNDVFGSAPEELGDMSMPNYNSTPTGPSTVTYAQGASNPVTGSFKAGKVGMTGLSE